MILSQSHLCLFAAELRTHQFSISAVRAEMLRVRHCGRRYHLTIKGSRTQPEYTLIDREIEGDVFQNAKTVIKKENNLPFGQAIH